MMATYQWEKLKQNLIADLQRQAVGEFTPSFCQELATAGLLMSLEDRSVNWKTNKDVILTAIFNRIDRWDIRQAKVLIDLFPDRFPKPLRNRKFLEAFIDDKKGWVIQ